MSEVRWLGKDDPRNPFTVDGYDCLAFVRAMRATTNDKDVADKFVALRKSVGANHVGQMPEGATAIEHRLVYPGGGTADGVLFKAQRMEQKWDIYLYGSRLYFCRSWTDALVFCADFSTTANTLAIETIWAPVEAIDGGPGLAVRQVDYLIKNHLLRRAVPHPLPEGLEKDPGTIGLYSFSQYGSLCCFGTYADTLRGDLHKPRPSSG
ncbi:hypothetical protein ACFPN2_34010 [Steroidobacter flavus]|uniref:Uncharacterized protein n=1 Tax=Steroidobacter flavus TaxID=1842136 RepID=A0ABV8T6W0_9GAMM